MIASDAPPLVVTASPSASTVTKRPVITSCLNPLAGPPPADRILVIRLGALGDVARTLPSLVGLRAHYPGAHICWLVERGASGVLEAHPLLDEVLVFPREQLVESAGSLRLISFVRVLVAFVRELRARRFDLVLDFHAILKSGVLSRLTGARTRVSYARPVAREGAWRFANFRAELTRGKLSRYERNAALLRYLAIDPDPNGDPPLPLSEASIARPELALDPRISWVAIHPGTSPDTPYKRYSVSGYADLAEALAAKHGVRCIVTHGPDARERACAEAVVAAAGGSAELAPPTRSVADLAVLISRCKLFVGSDSGPLHVASLVGTPVVQILGPTDPVENAPWDRTPSRSVRVGLACSPCRRGCAEATCMKIIPSQRVVSAACELLQTSETRRPVRRPRVTSAPTATAPPP